MLFKNYPQRLASILKASLNKKEPLRFNVKFLDDALDGISTDDLVVLTAKTGHGKTQLASHIAMQSAASGHRVHFFALEAHQNEIELRIRFKCLSEHFYSQRRTRTSSELPDYQKWVLGKQDHLLKEFEPDVDIFLNKILCNLNTFYTKKPFNAESFESHLCRIGDKTDLLVVDHLHYFDTPGSNENLEMKKTVKSIKDTLQFYRKPVILICQLRKSDKFNTSLIPSVDDIMGSSDVAKISTRIIVTASAKINESTKPWEFPTFIRILKNRLGGDRTRYVALTTFNSSKNEFVDDYKLGILTKNDTEFVEESLYNYPWWARK